MGDFLIYVEVRTAKTPKVRPSKATEEEAIAEMAELRAAKREHRDVDLPWLVVHGDDIVSASLEGQGTHGALTNCTKRRDSSWSRCANSASTSSA